MPHLKYQTKKHIFNIALFDEGRRFLIQDICK